MSDQACPFDARERDLIRREFGMHFGEYPSLADGLLLRTWRAGPHKNTPKIPAAVQTLLDRGLVEVAATPRGPRALFTAQGVAALRLLAADRRLMDPARYPRLRADLGLDPPDSQAAE